MKCPYCIKKCSKCGRLLVANTMNFHKKERGKYGLRAYCKRCKNKGDKKYYEEHKQEVSTKQKEWRENNKEYTSAYRKEYYEQHREKILENKKQYYENNKEEIKEKRKEYLKQYREDNKEQIKEKVRNWRINNPEKEFNRHIKRRSLKENQGNGITKEQWYEMMEFFDWKCAYSGIKFSFHNENKDRTIDHIVPLNKGGGT